MPTESDQRKKSFTNWCSGHAWFRHLPWKTHRPSYTENAVEDRCARCKHNRHRLLKLWWRSESETICNSCYTKGDWKDIMPQGYENVRTMKEIRARKAELEKQEAER
ncbi:uncharacterized protein M437DRAFT_45813 [Aureobasidium melanogenum CBS 110374]|uniref:Uncharacterized protein n=1 Tax=Aureobasidium melanogenum (strain CBS 110374) TaxID=1043003 RepID=A0A074VTG2_AURM1|nr:uncharacterized protein M437DRAFT_45813 [Aureobasidium melanogenum CBS 110374]KEQ63708.1 hypothetical protein M437DRAFT_45813 [Aureobasidium melanogenum CBS 110374]